MKASLETSALFLSTTLELKNFVSPDLKFHCFLLPNFRSKDSSRSFSDLETTGPFQSMFISASKADCFEFLSDFICFWRKLPGYPETFLTIWKIYGLSGNFPGYPETFWTIRKISTLSGNFPGYPRTFWTIWKILDYPETFRTIRKISRLSRIFPGYPETFRTIRKISGPSRNFPDNL